MRKRGVVLSRTLSTGWVGAETYTVAGFDAVAGGTWAVARTILKVIAGLVVAVIVAIVLMPVVAVLWRAITGGPDRPGSSRR